MLKKIDQLNLKLQPFYNKQELYFLLSSLSDGNIF